MTEQEVIKKFEELGWNWNIIYTELYLTKGNKEICIDKFFKAISYSYKDLLGNYHSLSITLQEHQLLTELFKCYKWIK